MDEEPFSWRSEEGRLLPALTPLARETKSKADALARALCSRRDSACVCV